MYRPSNQLLSVAPDLASYVPTLQCNISIKDTFGSTPDRIFATANACVQALPVATRLRSSQNPRHIIIFRSAQSE